MTGSAVGGRHAGVLIPLFSTTSSRSWWIGEIGDLVPLAAWLQSAGCDLVQLLPVNEMAPGDDSPYSAITAMGIDPLYVSIWAMDDFASLGGEGALPLAMRTELGTLRAARRVDYRHVRALKLPTLRACAERFFTEEWSRGTPRAAAFERFVEEQAWWLDDFALFRALRDRFDDAAWWRWPRPLLERTGEALDEARRELCERRFQTVNVMDPFSSTPSSTTIILVVNPDDTIDKSFRNVLSSQYQLVFTQNEFLSRRIISVKQPTADLILSALRAGSRDIITEQTDPEELLDITERIVSLTGTKRISDNPPQLAPRFKEIDPSASTNSRTNAFSKAERAIWNGTDHNKIRTV